MHHRLLLLMLMAAPLVGCQTPLRPWSPDTAALLATSRAGAARLIVSAPGLSEAALTTLATRHRLRLVAHLDPLGCAVMGLAGADAADLEQLQREPAVRYVERDVAGTFSDTGRLKTEGPSDPLYADQWDMQRMHAPEAWEVRDGSDHTIVALLDTGIDRDHPELASKLVEGLNVPSPQDPPEDDLGHGTATAGIVGAVANNGTGLVGVAPRALLMPVKVNVPHTGSVRAADAASGLVWAVDHGANVVNMSLGFTEGEDGLTSDGLKTLRSAVAYALDKGVMVVCAAGNIASRPVTSYPAAWAGSEGFEGLLAVGATDRADRRAAYSNYGPWLSVVAPADDIPALSIGGYGRFGGTSAAAPHVSGLAALLVTPSRPPSLKTLCSWIVGTARDVGPAGRDAQYGAGVVDALAAVQASTR
ncbi:MAG TPA: S8 family serine peptidase [Stenomitos sp.]